jgi:hypothetical protein
MPANWQITATLPFSLTNYGKEKEIFENMSRSQRSATPKLFALWLIETIRLNSGHSLR